MRWIGIFTVFIMIITRRTVHGILNSFLISCLDFDEFSVGLYLRHENGLNRDELAKVTNGKIAAGDT